MPKSHMRKITSLSGFLAFECAARHLNFGKAAEEICLTQSAISKQIKQLELMVGFKLFHRLTRRLELTKDGEKLYLTLSKSLDDIKQTLDNIWQVESENKIILSAPNSFALKWLIPRLSSLREIEPKIGLFIEADNNYIDLSKKSADMAIRYGANSNKGYHSKYFMCEYLIPVCSPDLLNSPVEEINDFSDYTLLHDVKKQKWQHWLKSTNDGYIHKGDEIYFSRDDLLIEAAISGQGIAICLRRLVEDDIKSGRLIIPYDYQVDSNKEYSIICLKENSNNRLITKITDWLISLKN